MRATISARRRSTSFDALRTFDETNVGEIWAQCPDSKGLGLAIGNRLKKAAGFHVEDADDGKIVIGITGGTGAGKTSLLRALERRARMRARLRRGLSRDVKR